MGFADWKPSDGERSYEAFLAAKIENQEAIIKSKPGVLLYDEAERCLSELGMAWALWREWKRECRNGAVTDDSAP